jgi:hypothetical protein
MDNPYLQYPLTLLPQIKYFGYGSHLGQTPFKICFSIEFSNVEGISRRFGCERHHCHGVVGAMDIGDVDRASGHNAGRHHPLLAQVHLLGP